jgi:hypothetical protein
MSAVAYAVASPGFPDRTDDQTGEEREAVNIAEATVTLRGATLGRRSPTTRRAAARRTARVHGSAELGLPPEQPSDVSSRPISSTGSRQPTAGRRVGDAEPIVLVVAIGLALPVLVALLVALRVLLLTGTLLV